MSEKQENNTRSKCTLWRGVKFVGKTLMFAAGAAAVANAWLEYSATPLGPSFDATYNRYPSRFGDVAYAVKGAGEPLLLLHAPRIGGSMAEWNRIIDALSRNYTVYALDYLGWGNSDRTRRICSAKDLAEEVQFFIEDVIAAPCSVMASGQSGAIAVNVAARAPELLTKLTLVCPTNEHSEVFEKVLWQKYRAPQFIGSLKKAAQNVASQSFLNTTISNVLTTKGAIAAMARELFANEALATPSFIAHLHAAAHQPGLRADVFTHLSGKLDIPWEESWEKCPQPALIIWGREANLDSATEWLARKPAARLEVIDDAKLLPHYEQGQEFLEKLRQWESDL